MKHCSKCFEVLPMNKKYFYKRKDSNDGFRNECITCSNLMNRKYVGRNKEKRDEYQKRYEKENKDILFKKRQMYRERNKELIKMKKSDYYNDNREVISNKQRLYYLENKEKLADYQREYVKRNQEKITFYRKKYYKNNKEKILMKNKKYRKENRELYRSISKIYKHKKRSLISTFTLDQWQQCLTHFNHQCAYCDCTEKLEQEHVIPVSKGGHYTADNIIPACRSCNASKNNKSLDEWYVNHQSYSTLRMDFIKDYLESNSLPILKEA